MDWRGDEVSQSVSSIAGLYRVRGGRKRTFRRNRQIHRPGTTRRLKIEIQLIF